MTPQPLRRPSRRQFLTGAATAAVTAVAGCSAVVDWIGDQALEDVNVLNGTDSPVSGGLVLTAADGTIALDERFDLASADSTGDDEEGNIALYENVWTSEGSYEATIEFDDTAIDGNSSATETVTITNPDEEMLLVAVGADDLEAPIAFRTGERFSEILDI